VGVISEIDCHFQRPRAVSTPKENKNTCGQSNGKYATVTLLFARRHLAPLQMEFMNIYECDKSFARPV